MRYIVKNCHNCPFCNNDNEYGTTCNHPRNDLEEYELTEYGSEVLPEKCPLRKEKAIIELTAEHYA